MPSEGPIVFISTSRVRPRMVAGLRAFLAAGAPLLEANKPQTTALLAYLDDAETTLTIVHVFADAAGFAAHVEGAGDRSDAASEYIESLRLTIHGTPTPSSLEAVRASTPPNVPIEVQDAFVTGFLRVPGRS